MKIKCIEPKVIYSHNLEGGHIDHDVLSIVVTFIVQRSSYTSNLFYFPCYSSSGKISCWPYRFRYYLNESNIVKTKLSDSSYKRIISLIKIYKSQYILLNLFVRIFGGYKNTFGFEYLITPKEIFPIELPKNLVPAYEAYLPGKKYKYFKMAVKNLTNYLKKIE